MVGWRPPKLKNTKPKILLRKTFTPAWPIIAATSLVSVSFRRPCSLAEKGCASYVRIGNPIWRDRRGCEVDQSRLGAYLPGHGVAASSVLAKAIPHRKGGCASFSRVAKPARLRYLRPCSSRGATRHYSKAAKRPICRLHPRGRGMATTGRTAPRSATGSLASRRQLRNHRCDNTKGEPLAAAGRSGVAAHPGSNPAAGSRQVASNRINRGPNEQP